ncbi:hypothetical protein VD0002_g7518 [Verticillium dahliae]|nr:hypothetical protein VD0003_g679 [Verticillium dahliae]PNH60084.1 hypothetical protein VD0002_g7518 [Verticillium dahliae]
MTFVATFALMAFLNLQLSFLFVSLFVSSRPSDGLTWTWRHRLLGVSVTGE